MKIKNQKGQSTIEFIFTFVFGVSMILMIFNSSMNYISGYLAHYATFMASRVYLTADSHLSTPQGSLNGAEERARQTFNTYALGIFKIPDGSFRINPAGQTDASTYLTVGGSTVFSLSIDVLGKIAGQSKLDYVSESFLGKEPTRAECFIRTCKAITGRDNCSLNDDITVFDDGC